MSADLSGSHPSTDVDDKIKSYQLMINLLRYGIVAVLLILIAMAFFLL